MAKRKNSGQYEMFLEIWEEREHVSFISGKNLERYANGQQFVWLFAHVLGKGAYPKYKLNKDNVVLLTPDEHVLYDAGTLVQREKYERENVCDWNRLYNLQEKLKHGYHNK
jgi:hypothetical protein